MIEQLLGSTATMYRLRYSFPVAEEFLELDYLSKIEELNIRENFTQFSLHLELIKGANEYGSSQYTNVIEPYFIEHINYSDVAQDRFTDFLVKGGPKTDYDELFDDLSLWNIITFKLETLSLQRRSTKRFVNFLKTHRQDLENASKGS